jgi:hypothetical protein
MRTLLVVALALMAGITFAQGQPAAKPVLDPKMGLPGARFPSISPDGKTVVYTLHGDLWSMPTTPSLW